MKRTDLERRERELKRVMKREAVAERRNGKGVDMSVGDFITSLHSLFRYDEQEIFNTTDDIAILELLEQMKEGQPEKQWDNIIRKAIKKTGIAGKEKAFEDLKTLMGVNGDN